MKFMFNDIVAWSLILTICITFILLALKSDILRDTIDDLGAFTANAAAIPQLAAVPPNKINRPYSLSKVQFGVWTVIISCTYVYLSLSSHVCVLTLTTSSTAVILLGISAGTAAFGNIIDQSQSNQAAHPRHQNAPGEGFFKDILSDDQGISIHRFQNVVWTLIAITIYLFRINPHECSLPEVDNSILTLTGISSATYLGLKINENR